MSNKLYSEKEIKRLLKKQIIFDDDDFDKLTPIELPTDAEIDKNAPTCGILSSKLAFNRGAKWMRDKIGGNNEQ